MTYAREYYWANRDKINEWQRAWYARTKDRYRDRKRAYRNANKAKARAYVASTTARRRETRLARAYGIDSGVYDALLVGQSGRCAICHRTPEPDRLGRTFHVDHDHVTGKVRGLLCGSCNGGIGYLGDSIELLEAALAYLRMVRP